jgi:oligoendopeptidase F
MTAATATATTPAAAPTKPTPKSSADGVAWDLADLYAGLDDPRIAGDLDAAHAKAKAFESAYRGKVAVDGGPAPELLARAVAEMEALTELRDKPAMFASLSHAAKNDDPARGRLLTLTRERSTEISKHILFFELDLAKLPTDVLDRLIAHPALAKHRHYLERVRLFSPYNLSEPEEKILDEKAVTGRSAFGRLFNETVSAIRCPFEHDGHSETMSVQRILGKLYDSDRAVRKAAHVGLTKGLQDNVRLTGYILNTIVADHRSDCGLRKYPTEMAARNLDNEISQEVVDALMAATERRHPTVHRYYRLKGRLLGLGQLFDYDRYAPLFADLPACDWKTAERIVRESYAAFDPEAGRIIGEFFDRRWIDAEPRPGKQGGAFSSSGVPSAHPYILMSFDDKLRDVMTLAHELGHGLHQYLSRRVGYLQCHTPLTTAETASVFGEFLTFRRLMEMHADPRVRLGMLCSKIEDAFATVFRQVVLTRFEKSVHKARREEGELHTERFNELWLAANRPMHGEAVELTPGYGWWWSYIGHFIRTPFYCYAYAFGELLVLALVQRYRQEGAAFVPKYLEMLAAGGSQAPHVLVGKLGLDVNDPKFWDLGLTLLDDMVTEAEGLAAKL